MVKEDYIRILNSMGFDIEYNQWDVKNKGWIRFRHNQSPQDKEFALIIYNDLEPEANFIDVSKILIKTGKYLKMQQVMSLD